MREVFPELTQEKTERITEYLELLREGNRAQNLTRLTGDTEFIRGQLWDVVELERSGFLEEVCADLGSGTGVPGLISAILSPRRWFLIESELRKAEFLIKTTERLGLSREVTVVHERIEKSLPPAQTLVAKALGKVDEIYKWIEKSSTWNSLILLKGPAWSIEWERFKKSKSQTKLSIKERRDYTIPTLPAPQSPDNTGEPTKANNNQLPNNQEIFTRSIIKLGRTSSLVRSDQPRRLGE